MEVSKYIGGGRGTLSPQAGNRSAELVLAQQVTGASQETEVWKNNGLHLGPSASP